MPKAGPGKFSRGRSEQSEHEDGHERGRAAPSSSPIGKIASPKKRPSSAWPAGFGALAITVRPPPATAPSNDRQLRRLVERRHERREIGDERVVVERGQHARAEEERRLREAGEDGRDPPALKPAVNHEAGEEEADEQRRTAASAGSGRAPSPREAEEDQEAAQEQRRVVGVDDRPGHEQTWTRRDPGRHREQRWRSRRHVFVRRLSSGTAGTRRRAPRGRAGTARK